MNPRLNSEEQPVWAGGPSQVENFRVFLLCFATCWLIIPVFIALWKWLVVRNIRYTLTSQRLRIRAGVFNKTTEDVELYRVRDFRIVQPFFLRLFRLSHIVLVTSDMTQPLVVLRAVPGGEALKDTIRDHVEHLRQQLGVRQIDT